MLQVTKDGQSPQLTWHQSWLESVGDAEPDNNFVDPYAMEGLRGVYIASTVAEGVAGRWSGTPPPPASSTRPSTTEAARARRRRGSNNNKFDSQDAARIGGRNLSPLLQRHEEIALRRQCGGREELGRRHAEDPPRLPGVPAGSLLQASGLGGGGVGGELARSAGQEQTQHARTSREITG